MKERSRRMRILIIGGGIAGLTLAGLLRQRGFEPTVVERAEAYGEAGYVLQLWPMGSRVLRGLELDEHFREASEPLELYTAHDGRGNPLKSFRIGKWVERYGDVRTLPRTELLEILGSYGGGLPVSMGTTVERLEQAGDEVRARLSDGSEYEFDLVVGADGIHSSTRQLVFGDLPLKRTGLESWWWWFDPGIPHEQMSEFWGAGSFFGIYPARELVTCAAICSQDGDTPDTTEGQREFLRSQFAGTGGNLVGEALDGLEAVDSISRIEMADIKMREWHKGRVLLIGDASAAFLPTAGVGASMAMESAAVLADELSRATPSYVPEAIRLFVERRRRRVDAIQAESRRLLKLMVVESPALASARDAAMRVMSEDLLLRNISRSMAQPI